MQEKFYLDTAIWRDYYENRKDKFRPLGEWALYFLHKTIKNKNIILYSDFVVKELENKYSIDEINNIFRIIKKRNLLVKVKISKKQIKKASMISKKRKVAFGDALHSILARDNNSILISRDKHFQELTDIVKIKKPEDLI